MSDEPIVMRCKSNGCTTKVLPEFIQIYIESGWVIEGREAHRGGKCVIPDEAIEAAAEALVASTLGDRSGIKWEEFFEAARGALNAAAPHIAFAVLEEAAISAEEQELDHITPRAIRRRARSYRREARSSDD